MTKNSKNSKHGLSEYYTMKKSKTCALLLPKKMVQLEICDVLSVQDEYLQTKHLNQQGKPVAKLLDPQFVFSTQKKTSGDPSDGIQ
jgi:hypothetical protein